MVVACNQKKATEGAKFLEEKGFAKVKPVYPNLKAFSQDFQAVVVYHKRSNEVNLMKDLVRSYEGVPIKVSIGEEVYNQAASVNLRPFVYGEVDGMIEYLKSEWTELNRVMSEVFRKFDKDNSNYIDAKELKQISKELSGKAMTNAELEEVMLDFHVSKENKISERQFKQWWASGKQSLSPLMRKLLGAKLNTIKFFDSISENLRQSLEQTAAEAQAVDIQQSEFTVSFNKFEHSGLMLNAKVLFFSPHLEEQFNAIKTKHGLNDKFNPDEHILFQFGFTVKGTTPAEAAVELGNLFDLLMLPEPYKSMVSIIQDGQQVSVSMPVPTKLRKEDLMSFKPVLEQVQSQAKVNQDLEVTLRLATSPKIIIEGEEAMIMELLKGFQLDVKVNLWKKISSIMSNMLANGQFPDSLLPILGGVAPAFMLKINGKLEIEVDEEMR